MARMIDEMLVEGVKVPPRALRQMTEDDLAELRAGFEYGLNRAVTFCVDNVTEYLYATLSKEDFDYRTDFPNVTPPFEFTWMETHKPSLINSEVHGKMATDKFPPRWGVLLHAVDVKQTIDDFAGGDTPSIATIGTIGLIEVMYKNEIRRVLKAAKRVDGVGPNGETLLGITSEESPDVEAFTLTSLLIMAEDPKLRNYTRSMQYDHDRNGVRWFVRATLFTEMPPGRGHQYRFYGPMIEMVLAIDSRGQLIGEPRVGWAVDEAQIPKNVLANPGTDFFPFMMALSFLNCRNVRVETKAPPEKVARKFKKRHGREPVTYRVLDIIPLRKVSSRRGDGTPTGQKVPVHIVRGHFKTYTDANPLFGKHVGTYFWHDTIRGSVEEGIVDKEYDVHQPGWKRRDACAR